MLLLIVVIGSLTEFSELNLKVSDFSNRLILYESTFLSALALQHLECIFRLMSGCDYLSGCKRGSGHYKSHETKFDDQR